MDILLGLGWRTWAPAAHMNCLPLRATDPSTICPISVAHRSSTYPPEPGYFGNRDFLLLLHYGVVHLLYPLALVYVDRAHMEGFRLTR